MSFRSARPSSEQHAISQNKPMQVLSNRLAQKNICRNYLLCIEYLVWHNQRTGFIVLSKRSFFLVSKYESFVILIYYYCGSEIWTEARAFWKILFLYLLILKHLTWSSISTARKYSTLQTIKKYDLNVCSHFPPLLTKDNFPSCIFFM